MKLPAVLLLVLPALLMGCPSDTEEDAPAPSSHSSGSPGSHENAPVPAGQHEPDVPDSEDDATTSEGDDSDGDEATTHESSASSTDDVPAPGDVTVQQLDWEGVLALVEGHRGKVVVVDIWSLSCEPCLREFPNLVALSNEHANDVACISVSTDYQGLANRPLDYYQPKVLEFVTSKNAQFENVLCTVPKFDLFEVIDINSEPTILVFNQAGEQAMVFTGPQENDSELSYEQHVIPYVESLLASSQ